jgi:hypothetical protein
MAPQTAAGKGTAQISNLLYRRFSTCCRCGFPYRPHSAGYQPFGWPADCKSAIQQIANLRYDLVLL